MTLSKVCAVTVTCLLAVVLNADDSWTARPAWAKFFADAGVTGTIVVVDERDGSRLVHGAERAHAQFVPASTFKVPHTLFALDAGVARDEFQTFKWDGRKREVAAWDADQTLRSAMRDSTVWVYQLFARQLGDAREREYLNKLGYGNADTSGGLERFWLDGGLRISAVQQVAMLQRLHRNELPFRVEHQRLVKDLMINEATREYILRAKTGWGGGARPQVGWWVGWVERREGAVFFALNIAMAADGDASKREAIGRAVLRDVGALPRP